MASKKAYYANPSSPVPTGSRNLPSHAVLPSRSLNPVLQLWQALAPSTVHEPPDGGTPFEHEQTFASHLLSSSLTFHPGLQADTMHPDEYDAAFAMLQPANAHK